MKTSRAVILIVDDDPSTRDGLQRALRAEFEVLTAERGEVALEVLSRRHVDLLLTDLRMPGLDGLTLLQRAMALSDPPVCVLLTAYGSVETAVDAMKRGAYDFLTKPVNLDQLEILVRRALRARQIETENQTLQQQLDERYGLEQIVSHAPSMREMFDIIRQAAPTQATILIQGESGTGKELVAQAIHRLSPRARGPFVAVHCAALSTTLLESELFGHEKGAFTGANERRRGRFELADGGTLFLDEVSEIDASIQVKLLRVLETRTFERVGGATPISVDIRIIAATNRVLRDCVTKGSFREDLYYRLDVVNLNLPPLRERAGDVPLLAQTFLAEFRGRNGREGLEFTADTLALLSAYDWPGNVRELRNTIEKMVVLARGPKLTARDVPPGIRAAVETGGGRMRAAPAAGTSGSLEETERQMILGALRQNGGNRTQAADQLGISRRTLHRKVRQYQAAGIEVP